MKITVTCNICSATLLVAEGANLEQSDADSYQQNTSCNTDGPVQTFDQDGNPSPMDHSNIVASLSD